MRRIDIYFSRESLTQLVQTIKRMSIKATLIQQLKRVEPIGLDNQVQQLKALFDDTVANGQGNSLLLSGPSGTGKSLVLSILI